jgi:hypothetical protein
LSRLPNGYFSFFFFELIGSSLFFPSKSAFSTLLAAVSTVDYYPLALNEEFISRRSASSYLAASSFAFFSYSISFIVFSINLSYSALSILRSECYIP